MGKRYINNPAGKRPPFEFELADDEQGTNLRVFVCTGRPQMLDLMDFAQYANADLADPTAALELVKLFEQVMGPDVYVEFRQYCRDHDTDNDVQLAILSDMVTYALAGRNLGGSSPSSPGQSTTGTTSSPGLLSAQDIEAWRAGVPVAPAFTPPVQPQMPVMLATNPAAYQQALDALQAQRASADAVTVRHGPLGRVEIEP